MENDITIYLHKTNFWHKWFILNSYAFSYYPSTIYCPILAVHHLWKGKRLLYLQSSQPSILLRFTNLLLRLRPSPQRIYPFDLENMGLVQRHLQGPNSPVNLHVDLPAVTNRRVYQPKCLSSPQYLSPQSANNPSCYNAYWQFLCSWNFPACRADNTSQPMCLSYCTSFYSNCGGNTEACSILYDSIVKFCTIKDLGVD